MGKLFKLHTPFAPAGSQPEAIKKLSTGRYRAFLPLLGLLDQVKHILLPMPLPIKINRCWFLRRIKL